MIKFMVKGAQPCEELSAREVGSQKNESPQVCRREAQVHAEKGHVRGKVVVRVNAETA